MRACPAQLLRYWLIMLSLLPFNGVAADTDHPATSTAARAPALGADSVGSGYLLQLVVGLLFVLVCIVVLAWLAKRVNRWQSSSDGSLQVLGGISMGARERIVLVQVGTTQLLLGVAPGSINMLHQLEQPLESSHARTGDRADLPFARGFADKLNAALSRNR